MIRIAPLAVALAIVLVGCGNDEPRQEAEAQAESTGPFPDASELYDQVRGRIAEVGSGHVEGRLDRGYWEFTSDFAAGAGADFVETTVDGPDIEATILRLGEDVYVQDHLHLSRPTAWLPVTEADDVDAHQVLVESLGELLSGPTPAFGIDQLREAEELELGSTGPLLTVYEGIIDVRDIGALGVNGILADAAHLVKPVAEIKIFINKDGLPERIETKIDFETGDLEYFFMFVLEYSQWGEPVPAPERPIDLFDSAEEFARGSPD